MNLNGVRDGGQGPSAAEFTKTGDVGMERIHARHFVGPGKGPFHPPGPRDHSDAGA